MRSYQAARRSFGFFESISIVIIAVGVVGIGAAIIFARETNNALALIGALPGVVVIAIGFFAKAYTQTARATVDSAEYAQLSLKIAREQLELSKQMLRHATGNEGPVTYSADEAPQLEGISFDTAAPQSAPTPSPYEGRKPDRLHTYSNTRIKEYDGKFVIEDKSYDTLDLAKLALDERSPQSPFSKIKF